MKEKKALPLGLMEHLPFLVFYGQRLLLPVPEVLDGMGYPICFLLCGFHYHRILTFPGRSRQQKQYGPSRNERTACPPLPRPTPHVTILGRFLRYQLRPGVTVKGL